MAKILLSPARATGFATDMAQAMDKLLSVTNCRTVLWALGAAGAGSLIMTCLQAGQGRSWPWWLLFAIVFLSAWLYTWFYCGREEITGRAEYGAKTRTSGGSASLVGTSGSRQSGADGAARAQTARRAANPTHNPPAADARPIGAAAGGSGGHWSSAPRKGDDVIDAAMTRAGADDNEPRARSLSPEHNVHPTDAAKQAASGQADTADASAHASIQTSEKPASDTSTVIATAALGDMTTFEPDVTDFSPTDTIASARNAASDDEKRGETDATRASDPTPEQTGSSARAQAKPDETPSDKDGAQSDDVADNLSTDAASEIKSAESKTSSEPRADDDGQSSSRSSTHLGDSEGADAADESASVDASTSGNGSERAGSTANATDEQSGASKGQAPASDAKTAGLGASHTAEKQAETDTTLSASSPADEASKPQTFAAPLEGGADDLKRISGVGPKLERLLNDLGVYHFEQIANWDADNIAWVDGHLKFVGRIERDNWVGQAADLAEQNDKADKA
ncbi:MAG: hypothetical protein AAFQ42_10995 [Pseudomonadota bacterium]